MSIQLNSTSGGSVSLDPVSSLASDITLTLPDSVGSAGQYLRNTGTAGTLEFGSIVQGINEADLWYLSANTSTNGVLSSNLARNTFTGATKIGTGMSESSGIFSFPSTGKWLVFACGKFDIDSSDSCQLATEVTLNNSTYSYVAFAGDGNNGSGARLGSATSFYLLDVTDTSNVKVRFEVSSLSGASLIQGSATYMATHFLFIRLGDT